MALVLTGFPSTVSTFNIGTAGTAAVCTDPPLAGTGLLGDCVRIAPGSFPCEQLQFDGLGWLPLASPSWTPATVGPVGTNAMFNTLLEAFTAGCNFVRVIESLSDSSVWSLPALGLTNAMVYIDPGVTLELFGQTPGSLDIRGAGGLRHFLLRGSGPSSILRLSPPAGVGSIFLTDGGSLVKSVNLRIDHPAGTGTFLDDTAGLLAAQFVDCAMVLGSGGAMGTPFLILSRNEVVEFHQCSFTGLGTMVQIVVGNANGNVNFTDCLVEGVFANGVGALAAISLPSNNNRMDGVWYRLTSDATFSLGGVLSDINARASNISALRIELVTDGMQLNNINVSTFLPGAASNINMNNVSVSGFDVDGAGWNCSNLQLTGALTISGPGANLTNLNVAGGVTVGSSDNTISNVQTTSFTVGVGSDNNEIRGIQASTFVAVAGNTNDIDGLNIGTSLTLTGFANNLSNLQVGTTTTVSALGNSLDNLETAGLVTIAASQTKLTNANIAIGGTSLDVLSGGALTDIQIDNITTTGALSIGGGAGAHTNFEVTNVNCASLTLPGTSSCTNFKFSNCVSPGALTVTGGTYSEIAFSQCTFNSISITSSTFFRSSLSGCNSTGAVNISPTLGFDRGVVDACDFDGSLTIGGGTGNCRVSDSFISPTIIIGTTGGGSNNILITGCDVFSGFLISDVVTGLQIANCNTTAGGLDINAVTSDLQISNCHITGAIDIDLPTNNTMSNVQMSNVLCTGDIDFSQTALGPYAFNDVFLSNVEAVNFLMGTPGSYQMNDLQITNSNFSGNISIIGSASILRDFQVSNTTMANFIETTDSGMDTVLFSNCILATWQRTGNGNLVDAKLDNCHFVGPAVGGNLINLAGTAGVFRMNVTACSSDVVGDFRFAPGGAARDSLKVQGCHLNDGSILVTAAWDGLHITDNQVGEVGGATARTITVPLLSPNTVILGNLVRNATLALAFPGGVLGLNSVPLDPGGFAGSAVFGLPTNVTANNVIP
jgi:hypothetical protein